ncbi:MAG: NADH-quinone oxidoreductase subunit L [Alphaproteobacteria bacterium]|nr:NADH-quinone oxidoreductase subunit L [Alphaproteobacteria bacterium]MDA8003419.1 NADH-quinone oxidoreductase subunit L [Alphaproteobacteria bacterium]MDA8005232.1 NADH-quinone oxidoreductase subunit L [Alphaproteobacteria bacterium]MDA8012661.1 NADH-quinone oxidoreductase subunit L [Alphaproteobacteria bacterium]
MLASLIVLLPLVGSLLAGILATRGGIRAFTSAEHDTHNPRDTRAFRGRDIFAAAVTTVPMILSALLSCFLYLTLGDAVIHETLFTWIRSGALEVSWAVYVDRLTAVMFCVVTLVSAAVHVYSLGYMRGDRSLPRFMCYLSLFTFFMLSLVSADNFLQMFFGWEGVGLCSYLLIGYWHERGAANAAAVKAFVVNRVGDVGFALGIAGVFALFGTIEFRAVLGEAGEHTAATWNLLGFDVPALTAICLLLFVGAMGKSAQLGLHTWLPDAMEGPTPVSALIHAATMVTAGVFMVCRLSPMFELSAFALGVVAITGALTAIFAGTVALVQNDIKRIIAYSTCSQLGYMFFAAGVSAYGAAIFHLTTHAFFKALLFLGAGAVITALHHRQDIRAMGGLAHALPLSCAALWLGSLALMGVGIPGLTLGLAGFFSKDAILEAGWAAGGFTGWLVYVLGLAAAVLTAFYSLRLLFVVFHLPQDAAAAASARAEEEAAHADTDTHEHDAHDEHDDIREPSRWMLYPLGFLSIGAIFAGAYLHHDFVGEHAAEFWHGALSYAHDPLAAAHGHIPFWVKLSPVAMGVVGAIAAVLLYFVMPARRAALTTKFARAHRFLMHKWYFDEIYNLVFVRNTWRAGGLFFRGGDKGTIDRFGPDGASLAASQWGKCLRILQSGYLYHYALAMLAGLVLLMGWMLIQARF